MAYNYRDPNEYDDVMPIPGQGGGGNPEYLPSPTASPTAPTPAGQAGKPGSYNSPAVDARIKQLVADFIKQNGLTASQQDPSSLHKIADYLKAQGINAQVDWTDENGHTGGIQIDGHPYQLIDGSNRWTELQPWEGGDDFFDALPSPDQYQTPERPGYLQGEFKLPQWNEQFKDPTAQDLENSPGYATRMAATQRGLERGAAAKGSILSGGFVGRTMPRVLGEQSSDEFQKLRGNAFDSYMQRYGAFSDNRTSLLAARGVNENAYESDVANSQSAYDRRYRTWRDLVGDRFKIADLGRPTA